MRDARSAADDGVTDTLLLSSWRMKGDELTRLVDEAPTGKDRRHQIRYDGYRMHSESKAGT